MATFWHQQSTNSTEISYPKRYQKRVRISDRFVLKFSLISGPQHPQYAAKDGVGTHIKNGLEKISKKYKHAPHDRPAPPPLKPTIRVPNYIRRFNQPTSKNTRKRQGNTLGLETQIKNGVPLSFSLSLSLYIYIYIYIYAFL